MTRRPAGNLVRLGKALPRRLLGGRERRSDSSPNSRVGPGWSVRGASAANCRADANTPASASPGSGTGTRQAELSRLNQELEETNRGVVALYAELDEKAVALRRADELKSRFPLHVSHEFRTPLNSILALRQLLIRRADGDLSAEQERQVDYIRTAAGELSEMVNDLLDLAKVEAGKTEVRLGGLDVGHLFRALRGIMRPLAVNDAVALVFEEPAEGLTIQSDEAKVSQIVRNLISNALKFTEHGEVRVSSRLSAGGDQLEFRRRHRSRHRRGEP